MNIRVAGLVLAGGAARRVGGGDKPLLAVGGRTMLQAAIEALDLPEIAISANGDPSRFAAFGCPVLPDGVFAGRGPLAGVLAGLRWSASVGAEVLVTAPGDMPFLPRRFHDHLMPAPRAVVAQGQRHHLLATWPVGCADQLNSFLHMSQTSRVRDFAERIGMIYVETDFESCDVFVNVNTAEELAHSRQISERAGKVA